MTTITLPRAVVEQALETIEGLTRDRLFTAEWAGKHGATVTALRAALAQQAEPVDSGYWGRVAARQASRIKQLETTAQQALEALELGDEWHPSTLESIAALRAALAQQAEPVKSSPPTKDWCLRMAQIEMDAGAEFEIGPALAHQAEPVQDQRCRAEPRSDGDFVCDCKIGKCPGRSAEPAQQAEPETCTWHQDGDSDSGVYATSCRHYFNLEDGTPEDNKMQWCCYCGKKLVQELITEGDDE